MTVPNLTRDNLLYSITNGYPRDINMTVNCSDASKVVVYASTGPSTTQYTPPVEIKCGQSIKIGVYQIGFMMLMVKNSSTQAFTFGVQKTIDSKEMIPSSCLWCVSTGKQWDTTY